MPPSETLQGFNPPVQLKLAMLWASVVFCYIYGDYFGLYVPGSLQSILDGRMGPLGATTQNVGSCFRAAGHPVSWFSLSLALLVRLNR
ncbi:MAG: hypothetical protein U1F23_13710 [Lysobacterales bacterium]